MKGHIEEIQQKELKTNSPQLSSKNMFSKPTADYRTKKMAMLYTVRSHHFCAANVGLPFQVLLTYHLYNWKLGISHCYLETLQICQLYKT
jgi:hypothetical protein